MFPGPTLLAAASAIVETALNQALELDPAGRQKLLEVLDQPLQLTIATPSPLFLGLNRNGQRVRVSSQPEAEPGITLTGKPLAFAALITGDDRVFSDGRLQISGDPARAQQLQRALELLNPDWEAAMARHMGDVPAHFLGQRIRQAAAWSRQTFNTMNANIEEYVHEESRALPGRHELDATFRDIDDISQRVEQLEARLQQLEYPGSTDQPEIS